MLLQSQSPRNRWHGAPAEPHREALEGDEQVKREGDFVGEAFIVVPSFQGKEWTEQAKPMLKFKIG